MVGRNSADGNLLIRRRVWALCLVLVDLFVCLIARATLARIWRDPLDLLSGACHAICLASGGPRVSDFTYPRRPVSP